jgi:hypothetical protein
MRHSISSYNNKLNPIWLLRNSWEREGSYEWLDVKAEALFEKVLKKIRQTKKQNKKTQRR